MTTKPSNAPWADDPFQLIKVPMTRPELANEKHCYVHVASEMTHTHNVLIRGLNAIIQQAPYIQSEDVKDLLRYASNWVKMVDHHHSSEESFIFPEIEKFTKAGFMHDPQHQHTLFHDGLERLLAYTKATTLQPQEYHWDGPGGMKEILDSFSKPLMDHLYAEIDFFLSLRDLDSVELQKAWDKGEANATKQTSVELLTDVFPCVLGCADKTYEGGEKFPPLPAPLPYLVKYVFTAGSSSVWRFNPCDYWRKPRPLTFGPKT